MEMKVRGYEKEDNLGLQHSYLLDLLMKILGRL